MKSKGNPSHLKSTVAYQAILLGASAMIATTVLSFGNLATRDAIALRLEEDLKASISQVIGPELYDNDLLSSTIELEMAGDSPLVVYQATRDGDITAVVFEVAENGYSGTIRSIIAVDTDGVLLGARVLSHTETPGLGDKIEAGKDDWILGFAGLSLENPPRASWLVKKDGGAFDQFTGATITPRAVIRSIREGLELFEMSKEELLVLTDPGDSRASTVAPESGEAGGEN